MAKAIKITIGKSDNGWLIQATLSPRLYKTIITYTNCPANKLSEYFDENKRFVNCTIDGRMEESKIKEIKKNIEKIANSIPEQELWNTLLTDRERAMMPVKMHEIMQKKYNLTGDVEWHVSLFLVSLGRLITDPPFWYRSIEDDLKPGDCRIEVLE